MNGPMLLQHAAGVIEHRERSYGPPSESFDAIAARWSLVLGISVSPAAGRAVPDRSEAGPAQPRSIALRFDR
jgi:hypothetical protein